MFISRAKSEIQQPTVSLLKTANISSWVNSQPLAPPPPPPDASIHIKVWDAITYPFSNFSRCTVEIWKRIYNKQFSQMPAPLAALWKTAGDQDSPPKVLHDVLHTHTVTFWHIIYTPKDSIESNLLYPMFYIYICIYIYQQYCYTTGSRFFSGVLLTCELIYVLFRLLPTW